MRARRAVLNVALASLDIGDEDAAAHTASLLRPNLELAAALNAISAVHIARAVRDGLEEHGAAEHVLDAADLRLDEAELLLLPPTSRKTASLRLRPRHPERSPLAGVLMTGLRRNGRTFLIRKERQGVAFGRCVFELMPPNARQELAAGVFEQKSQAYADIEQITAGVRV